MKTIWKYKLELGRCELEVPSEASILSVHEQGDDVCLWLVVDDEVEETQTYVFHTIGTGHAMPDVLVYPVGTAHCGRFVWHTFVEIVRGEVAAEALAETHEMNHESCLQELERTRDAHRRVVEALRVMLGWHDEVRRQEPMIPSPFVIEEARDALAAAREVQP